MAKFIRNLSDFFALKATINIEDVHIGYGTIILMIGLAGWLAYRVLS